jgi:hypothetical protein
MRTRLTATAVCLAALAALAAPAVAFAAKTPSIKRATLMRLHVGDRVTIRGRNFSSRRKRNTVIFRAPNGRSAFVKPRRATTRRLVVVVPSALSRILAARASGTMRFRLRVLTRKFSSWTPRRLSPVIVGPGRTSTDGGSTPGGDSGGGSTGGTTVTPPPPPDCDHDGIPDSTDTASDADLLSDASERSIGIDPCKADTDGDGVEDGFELQSAIDLNHYPGSFPLPYPGKRPYPNPLDPSDGATDYDGDGLTNRDEFLAWIRYSADGAHYAAGTRPTTLSNMLYSDGLQRSRSVGAPALGTLDRWALDLDGDGVLGDDERDADGDGLGNWDEMHGQFFEAWWPAEHDGQIEPKESKYPDIDFLDNEDLPNRDALADPDIDGDGVVDGDDDADHDGLTNQFEVRRPGNWDAPNVAFVDSSLPDFSPGANPWAYTNPFNPCKPFNSDRCHVHPPFGYYDGDERPPIGPDVPGGYPGSHPTTPAG